MTSILNYNQAAHEQALHDEGIQQGILQSVKKLMDSLGYTLYQALDALKVIGEDREMIAKAVKG